MRRLTDLYARFLTLFPEREFHYRAHGRVHYFRVSQRAQVGAFLFVAVALAWSAFATFYFVTYDRVLRDKEVEIAEARTRLANAQEVFMPQNAMPVPAMAWSPGAGAHRARNTEAPVAEKEPRPLKVVANPAIGSLGTAISRLRRDKATAERERDTLRSRLDKVTRTLGAKGEILLVLEEKTAHRITEIERVIAMTGLDPKKLVAGLNRTGKGGPRETIVPASGTDEEFALQTARLQRRLDRWEQLQSVLKRLPMIAPLDHYRKSSDFGSRTDPVTGETSAHHGTDFAYYTGAPVLATAPGKVVFAGWRGGYGWLVEIDHGMGIRTRYAHLKKVLVTKDQQVEFRDKIGLVGTSGRSTGPHVHYEVVFEGRPKDPMKFITAGKYVFKG